MKSSVAVLACLSTFALASAAHAIEADFTSIPPAAGANGASSWTFTTAEGYSVVVTPGPDGGKLYWDGDDGFGVNNTPGSYEYDEIDGAESLTVTFFDSSGTQIKVVVDSFSVTDLFNETRPGGPAYDEKGSYSIDGGPAVNFNAGNVSGHSNVNGTGTVLVGSEATSLTLTAPGKETKTFGPWWNRTKQTQDHEYSLGGVSFHVVSVPELSVGGAGEAMLLLAGIGLVLGGRRRRPQVA
jgi:hypothetical protein